MSTRNAKFSIGDIVKHKHFDFRGVIYDVDFEFNNSEEWYQSIPKDVRPRKDQPFYHLLAENNEIIEIDKNTTQQGLAYERFVPSLVKAVQELSAKVTELENKLGE